MNNVRREQVQLRNHSIVTVSIMTVSSADIFVETQLVK